MKNIRKDAISVAQFPVRSNCLPSRGRKGKNSVRGPRDRADQTNSTRGTCAATPPGTADLSLRCPSIGPVRGNNSGVHWQEAHAGFH